jgi:RND family efflux transporter MFP subunit
MVDIPESVSGRLKDGDTLQFTMSALPGQFFSGTVSRRAMNIDAKYRVENIQVDVINKKEQLKPGMYADVMIHMSGNPNSVVVPKSAVVTSTVRQYVLGIKNNMITKVDVTTGNETIDKIEVFGDLHPGDHVIENANDEINEGPVN